MILTYVRQQLSQNLDERLRFLRFHDHATRLLCSSVGKLSLVGHDNDDGHLWTQPLELPGDEGSFRTVIVQIDDHGIHRFPSKADDSFMSAARAECIPAVLLQQRTAEV